MTTTTPRIINDLIPALYEAGITDVTDMVGRDIVPPVDPGMVVLDEAPDGIAVAWTHDSIITVSYEMDEDDATLPTLCAIATDRADEIIVGTSDRMDISDVARLIARYATRSAPDH